MTLLRQLAIAALPGGIIVLVAYRLLRCHHSHEVWDRREVMGLRCSRCGAWRPATALIGEQRYRVREVEAEAEGESGIEKMMWERPSNVRKWRQR
ncbi:MAG: hypothetical protein KGL39_15980 [Patescibacteria group bacterium]|nr:hypothetical protein [Patescibacteria group bacterium]